MTWIQTCSIDVMAPSVAYSIEKYRCKQWILCEVGEWSQRCRNQSITMIISGEQEYDWLTYGSPLTILRSYPQDLDYGLPVC